MGMSRLACIEMLMTCAHEVYMLMHCSNYKMHHIQMTGAQASFGPRSRSGADVRLTSSAMSLICANQAALQIWLFEI